ncbi:MAG: hypothetical protein M1830_009263 [Pleopsidium flavum]|nr:MAG: hypothetical protein M1830_009263 [Pleopsidium flavum]
MADRQARSPSEDDPRDRTKFRNPESIAFLKRFGREHAARSSAQPQRSSLPPANDNNVSASRSGSEDDWRPQGNDDDQDVAVQAVETKKATEARFAHEAKKYRALSDAHEKEKNKENLHQGKDRAPEFAKPRAFVDPQDTAERVTWDESQGSTQQGQAPRNIKKGARSAVEKEEMSDPSEDESFQHNNRPVDVRKRRDVAPAAPRRAPVPVTQLPSRRPRSPQDEDYDEDGDEDDAIPREIREQVERHNRNPRADPPRNSQAQVAEEQRRVNRLAKNIVRAKAPAKVQTRRPWTEDQTSTLIEYIMEYGTSYAFIIKKLTEDGNDVLQGRDQIAMKDKARNIKTDYLKAGKELPHNFDKIPLNKALKDKLSAIGITYNDHTGLADYDDE